MKRFLIIATGILLPVSAAIADVKISVSAQYSNTVEYIDDGDAWFEGDEDRGDQRVSFEYQWCIYGGNHVLRYRQVFFHISNNSWSFGPWMIRSGYCHHSCHIHHTHHYYKPHPSPYWSRQHDKKSHGKYHYYYKPRNDGPRFDRPPKKVYHHEYYRDKHDGGHHDLNHKKDNHNRKQDELNRQRDAHNKRLDEKNRQRDEQNRQRNEHKNNIAIKRALLFKNYLKIRRYKTAFFYAVKEF